MSVSSLTSPLSAPAHQPLPTDVGTLPRLKVLWLANFPHPKAGHGHPVPWIAALAAALRQHPEVELSILNWESQLQEPVEEFDADGIHFIYLKAPAFRQDFLTLYTRRIRLTRRYLQQHHLQYDVIHLHGSEWQLQTVVKDLQRPVVLSVQGLVTECVRYLPQRWSRMRVFWELAGFYERRYLPAVHEFICRTAWDKAQIARLSPGARIHHNWEMLRPEFYRAATLPLVAPKPQVLFAGGDQEMKGFRETLVALTHIRQHSPLRLVIAGRLTLNVVNQTARKLGLLPFTAEEVRCVGFCNGQQLAELMRESFCLLHPSYIDNSPNTVCEAQMVGLPVVASDVGGVRALIEPGRTGLLSSLEPTELAAQVLALYQNPELTASLRHHARQVALERHDPDTIVQRTLAIYHTIC